MVFNKTEGMGEEGKATRAMFAMLGLARDPSAGLVFIFLNILLGSGEVSRLLRALAPLPEFLGSILSTRMAAHNHL